MIASKIHQSPPEKAEPARWRRPAVYRINRGLILLLVAAQWLTLQWVPTGVAGYVLDILVRSYGLFLLCSLAHEASHGNLGSSRRANLWWGRLAQLPTTVPNLSFRKTHHLHHRFTNEVGKDPDRFIHARVWWQLPLRALALPHAWLHFLYNSGRLRLTDGLEIATSYLMVGAFYGTAIAMVGPGTGARNGTAGVDRPVPLPVDSLWCCGPTRGSPPGPKKPGLTTIAVGFHS